MGGLLMAMIVTIVGPIPAPATDSDLQDNVWFFVDDPRLEGPSNGWWNHTSGGWANDYHSTYGIGNSSQRDNWAVWDIGHRHGRQPVFVWVPESPADVRATVRYRIYKNDELIDNVNVDQQTDKGWVRLGVWDFNGADVRIEAWDNETIEHYNHNNLADSRMGLDAVAMQCWSNCQNDSEEPTSSTTDHDLQDNVWFFVDDPRLEGPSNGWWNHTSGGWANDYHSTYGIGNSSQRDNWAVWDIGHRHGRQPVFVWVPESPADVRATVRYRIYKNDELIDNVNVDQQTDKGWVRLGVWDFNGADVRIEAWDNETIEHYNHNNLADSRMGLDAVAMQCWSNCQNDSEEPTQEERTSHTPSLDDYIAKVNEFNSRGNLCRQSADTHPANLGSGWFHADKWNFYVGECTSWVAFRLNLAGIPFHNQFGGNVSYSNNECQGLNPAPPYSNRWAHAKYWDDRARNWHAGARQQTGFDVRVSSQPVVGAVAQWETNHCYGHVAYVEEVRDNGNTIVVSEQNYRNHSNGRRLEWCMTSTTREIRKSGSVWPGGLEFIIFSRP